MQGRGAGTWIAWVWLAEHCVRCDRASTDEEVSCGAAEQKAEAGRYVVPYVGLPYVGSPGASHIMA